MNVLVLSLKVVLVVEVGLYDVDCSQSGGRVASIVEDRSALLTSGLCLECGCCLGDPTPTPMKPPVVVLMLEPLVEVGADIEGWYLPLPAEVGVDCPDNTPSPRAWLEASCSVRSLPRSVLDPEIAAVKSGVSDRLLPLEALPDPVPDPVLELELTAYSLLRPL